MKSFTPRRASAAVIYLCLTLSAVAQIPISTIEELQLIGGDPAYPLDGDYLQTQDIDASVTATWNKGAGFIPIGETSIEFMPQFLGSYDGGGHAISNLIIKRSNRFSVGLFHSFSSGELRNIVLENAWIENREFGRITGGIVGYAWRGDITNCRVSGFVHGADGVRIPTPGAAPAGNAEKGAMPFVGPHTGGIVGIAHETNISDCNVSGEVQGAELAGGVCATIRLGDINRCTVTANITSTVHAGGVCVDSIASYMARCHVRGAVRGAGDGGGIVVHTYGLTLGIGFGLYSYVVQSSADGIVDGDQAAGGIVGINYAGVVQLCRNAATVKSRGSAGGLAGVNRYSITDSYSTGAIIGQSVAGGAIGEHHPLTADIVSRTYASGPVIGDEAVGGLVGFNGGGTIGSSYWDVDISGQDASAGGIGGTTAEMKRQSTFAGWDFSTVWRIEEGVGYPYLSALGDGHACIASVTTHSADWRAPLGRLDITELLRVVQLYNAGGYSACPDAIPLTEDGFRPASP